MRGVLGLTVDAQARCAHWHSPLDIVALRLPCCGDWYACRECHDALAGHPGTPWPAHRLSEVAARCGACGHEMSGEAYLACGHRCPACAAPFNPGCERHRDLYFAPLNGDGASTT